MVNQDYYETDKYKKDNDEMSGRVDDLWRSGYDEELAYFGRQCAIQAASEFKDLVLILAIGATSLYFIRRYIPEIVLAIRNKKKTTERNSKEA